MPVFGKVVGLAEDTFSEGYWIATSKGHVAQLLAIWHGDNPGPRSPVVGIASTRGGPPAYKLGQHSYKNDCLRR